MAKKLLGLSFGRKGGNCDISLKMALIGAQREGVEIQYINTCNLKIGRCIGCGACDKVREKGGMSVCVFKDDFQFLEDAVMEADALIVAAPVYSLAPVGQYKNFVDKIGASHDRSALLRENERRRSMGWSEDKMIPAKYFKNRPVAFISVGGARTRGWTSMGLCNMHILGVSNLMIPVDAVDAYGMGDRVSPVLDEAFAERMKNLGKNVSEAVLLPEEQVTWKGTDEGVCPICHCNTLIAREGTLVECAVCGSEGHVSVVDGKLKVEYTPEQLNRSRYREGGLAEHNSEIKSMMEHAMAVVKERGDEIKEKVAALDVDFITEIKPNK